MSSGSTLLGSGDDPPRSCDLGLLCASNLTACAAAIRSLSHRIVWALVLGYHDWAPGYYYAAARSNNVVFSLSRANDSQLIEMSRLVLATPGGVVIPLYERYRRLLSSTFADNPSIVAPPIHVFRIFEGQFTGKKQTHGWLRNHGLGMYSLAEHDPDELRARLQAGALSESELPLVVKPSVGTNGMGVTVVRSVEELAAALRTHGEKPIVQEALQTKEEWGVYFIAYDGELLQTICLQFQFTSTLFVRAASGGAGLNSTHPVSCDSCPLPPYGLQRLVAATKYHGFGCLAVKERAPGQNGALIELNTRIGASHVSMLMPYLRMMLVAFDRRNTMWRATVHPFPS